MKIYVRGGREHVFWWPPRDRKDNVVTDPTSMPPAPYCEHCGATFQGDHAFHATRCPVLSRQSVPMTLAERLRFAATDNAWEYMSDDRMEALLNEAAVMLEEVMETLAGMSRRMLAAEARDREAVDTTEDLVVASIEQAVCRCGHSWTVHVSEPQLRCMAGEPGCVCYATN